MVGYSVDDLSLVIIITRWGELGGGGIIRVSSSLSAQTKRGYLQLVFAPNINSSMLGSRFVFFVSPSVVVYNAAIVSHGEVWSSFGDFASAGCVWVYIHRLLKLHD